MAQSAFNGLEVRARHGMAMVQRAFNRSLTTTIATWGLIRRRFGQRRFARFKPKPFYWLAATLLFSVSAAMLLDPLFAAGRSGWSRDLVAFGVNFTIVGKGGIYIVTLLVALFATSFVDWPGLARLSLRRATRLTQGLWFFLVAISLAETCSSLLKLVIGRARPRMLDEAGLYAFQPWQFDSAWASFPSGHATTIGAIITGLALIWPRLALPLAVVGLWLGFTRALIGAHYPSDVLAGLGLGAVIAILVAHGFTRMGFLFRRSAKAETYGAFRLK
jgi:membrane-associated phospholipid phosphatase